MSDKRETLPFRFVPGLRVPAGSLVVLLASPGVGKSMLALNWAWDLVKSGRPVLYHGHDTPWQDQAQRVMALAQDTLVDKVDPDTAVKALSEMTFHLRWSQVEVNAVELEELLKAEVEYLGEAPAMTIVDIVQDLIREDSPEAYSSTFSQLHVTAQKFHTCVLALHHTNKNNPTTPPTLNDDRYKAGARRAELMLGLSQSSPSQLRLEVLKNRSGGKNIVHHLEFYPERGRVD